MGTRKKRLQFGNNPDHISIRVRIAVRFRVLLVFQCHAHSLVAESLDLGGGMHTTECHSSSSSSAWEVMFSSVLVSSFVSKQNYARITQPILIKFSGKVTHGPRKKSLDFGDSPDHITLDWVGGKSCHLSM